MQKSGLKIVLFFIITVPVWSQSNVEFQGQVSGWLERSGAVSNEAGLGFRYLPELHLVHSLSRCCQVDIQLAANIYNKNQFFTHGQNISYSAIKPYRVWLRISGEQWELRFGLQKINFGPARLLRTLKWFDRIDPRDALQIADGVYALTARYYFLNNANFWLWGLYGNHGTKGLEISPTLKHKPEWGGRGQFPLPRGEAGISFHHRQLDTNTILPTYENRFAVDGDWDLGIGLWFESAVIKTDFHNTNPAWQKWLTIGTDYTFDWGNGWHITAENLRVNQSHSFSSFANSTEITAFFSEYRVNIVDGVTMGLFYAWKTDDWFRYFSWRRTYDHWLLDLSAFWNPKDTQLFNNTSSTFGGKGLRLLVAYNY